MFQEMRRKNQQLPEDVALEILQKETSGVLSLYDADGYPYGVPLSHSYADGKLYFHCALSGHKLDAIRNCNKACFTVIAGDDVKYDGSFTTWFTSVICFGRIRILEDIEERRAAHMILGEKFGADVKELWIEHMEAAIERMAMLEFEIEHITGKEAKELMRQRKAAASDATDQKE